MSDSNSSLSVVSNGAVIFFMGDIILKAIGFAIRLLLTRSLGAASFGVYSYAQTILAVTGVFARLGVTESIMRFVPEFDEEPRKQGRFITIAFCTAVGGSILVGILLFLSADWVNALTLENYLFGDVLRIFAILLPLQVITQAVANTFRAFEDAKYQIAIRKVIVPCLNLLSIASAIVLGASVVGVSAALVISGLLAVGIALTLLSQEVSIDINISTDRAELYRYYKFSIPLTLTAAGSLLYTRVDRLMVGYFLGDVEVGIYTISITLAAVTGLALTGINQLFPPVASKLHSKGHRNDLETVFQTVTRWSFTLSLLPALLLYVYRVELLSIFGSEFIAGSTVLVIFLISQITRTAVGPSGYMLMMTGHQYIVLFNRWFLGISNVVLNYILIIRMGFVGAAVASALTITIVNIFRIIEIRVLEGYNPYTRRFIKPIISGVIVLVITEFVRTSLVHYSQNEYLLIIFGGLIGTICYFIILFILGIDQVDYEMLDEIRS